MRFRRQPGGLRRFAIARDIAMTALPPYLKRGEVHCCYVYLLLSLPPLNHPAQLIVVASVYLIMAEHHVLRMGRRGYNALSSGDDYRTTSSQFALQRLLLWRSPLSLPLLILKYHKYITLIVARVRRSQSALVCQALLHRRFLLSVTDRQYAGLLAVPIIPAKRYHTILLRRDSDRRILCRCASTRRAAARRFNLFNTNTCHQRNRFYVQNTSPQRATREGRGGEDARAPCSA
jgi:hypothetical protein